MKKRKSLNAEMKANISSTSSTRKSASKIRFVDFLVYPMLSTRVTPRDIVSIAQKAAYEN